MRLILLVICIPICARHAGLRTENSQEFGASKTSVCEFTTNLSLAQRVAPFLILIFNELYREGVGSKF